MAGTFDKPDEIRGAILPGMAVFSTGSVVLGLRRAAPVLAAQAGEKPA